MSFKDRFDKFIDYFTEDGEDTAVPQQAAKLPSSSQKPELLQSQPVKEAKSPRTAPAQPQPQSSTENITRLHARQQELAQNRAKVDEKITIDVRYDRDRKSVV